ncbi:putative protein (DUF945 domain) [Campylobacter pinnipediorum subsp. caledonicus]|uniref:Uncharacterized protein n=1 Tax=Campylobacter pinnipediorum subsp. caledonicus TaxID=1874362 RepID=A0A1S6U700_9BACT|nr:DUF945 family protein [Campylobacter pinnipediorum]AQW85918.1 putative protein (DUF945 domain) [Campylobacter pinnipediorum subsp. caledonicus]AQW87526.1 putative protein (DUF945 domain) [Campylobacter pinnipediorum subsp. caledonicus]OPA72332.1 hypothetical protein BB381_01925 [Campylobacter pinnipediorum subsp. caledonicus]
MKKIIFIFIVFFLALLGFNYYYSNTVKDEFDSFLKHLDSRDDISVSNIVYDKSFFNSKSFFDLSIDNSMKEKIVFHISSDINTNFLMFLLNANNKILKSNIVLEREKNIEIATVLIKAGLFSDYKTEVNFKNFDDGMFFTKDIFVNLMLNKKYEIKDLKLNIGMFDFKQNDIYLKLDKFSYDLKYDSPVPYYDIFTKIYPVKTNISQNSLDFGYMQNYIKIGKTTYKSQVKIDDNKLFSSDDMLKIDKIAVNDFYFNSISINNNINHINSTALNKILEIISKYDTKKYDTGLVNKLDLVADILENNPKYHLNFKAKNGEKNKIHADLNLEFNGFKKKNNFNYGLDNKNILNSLNLNADIKFTPTFSDFLSQLPELGIFEPMLISGGILKQNDDSMTMSVRLDREKEDLIINDKVLLNKVINYKK